MITYAHGDILKADTQALVNTVNCVGFMGRGIALQFKAAFPTNFKLYEAACKRGDVQPGKMFVTETRALTGPRFIINFPTKRHWRGKSRMEDIDAGLVALVQELRERAIRSVAIPPLGSGLGGLAWADVRPRIAKAMEALPNVEVTVFEPGGGPADAQPNRSSKVPVMTPGRSALVGLMARYLSGLMEPWITLLEVHKLMYFLQLAGEPLRLQYTKALYGPYAENLRHVLHTIEGHFVSGYADGGDAPDKQLELVPGALEDATSFLQAHGDTSARFERVAELVRGFETPFGLELLATVHWVMAEQGARDSETVREQVYAWGPHKRRFTPEQLELAASRRRAAGWLPA